MQRCTGCGTPLTTASSASRCFSCSHMQNIGQKPVDELTETQLDRIERKLDQLLSRPTNPIWMGIDWAKEEKPNS